MNKYRFQLKTAVSAFLILSLPVVSMVEPSKGLIMRACRSVAEILGAQRRPLRLVLRSPAEQNGQGQGS